MIALCRFIPFRIVLGRSSSFRMIGVLLSGLSLVDSDLFGCIWVLEFVFLLFVVFICFRTPFYFEFGCFLSVHLVSRCFGPSR